MEAVETVRPFLAIMVSLIAAGVILKYDKNPDTRETVSIAAGIIKFVLVISMAPTVLAGGSFTYTLLTFVPGLDISFRVDALGLFFATVASSLWVVTTCYSIGYMRGAGEKNQTRFYSCFAVSVSSALAIAFSANLLTLFIFYEILSFSTFPLVAHKGTQTAFEGAKKYMIYLFGTSKTFFLAALILTYNIAGTLDFTQGGLFAGQGSSMMLTATYILFIAGIAKAGIMPFHAWLPGAMVAPTPVSALLHAVAVVKVGVFSVLRVIFHVFGVDLMQSLNLGIPTAFVVSFTIIMASIYALTRDNLKARLAYSTVSQLSYIILGAALLTPSSMLGSVLHIANHAFSKITLFFCAGSIYVATHKIKISELNGIGRKMPWTMTAFAIGTLSMIGVPPAAGFITKWYLAIGSIEADQIPILFVLLASTVLNAAYFVPVIYKAFFHKPKDPSAEAEGNYGIHHDDIQEAPKFVVVPLVFTSAMSLLIGLFPSYFMALAKGVFQ